MGSRGQSSRRIKVMSEQEYLDSKGVGSVFSGASIDKIRGNRQLKTEKGQKKFEQEMQKINDEYYGKREKYRQEYRDKVKKGKIRDRTSKEKAKLKLTERLEIAQKGDPNSPRTLATRRMLGKMGIDWKTGKKLK